MISSKDLKKSHQSGSSQNDLRTCLGVSDPSYDAAFNIVNSAITMNYNCIVSLAIVVLLYTLFVCKQNAMNVIIIKVYISLYLLLLIYFSCL
jgi:hypothetical protein